MLIHNSNDAEQARCRCHEAAPKTIGPLSILLATEEKPGTAYTCLA